MRKKKLKNFIKECNHASWWDFIFCTLAWKLHGVAEGRTRLSDFTFTFHFHALEKEMATHPQPPGSVLAWRIPGTGEPGGLLSVGLHRVGHDWSDLAAYIYIYIYTHINYIYSYNWYVIISNKDIEVVRIILKFT